jgi:hypothetical protein
LYNWLIYCFYDDLKTEYNIQYEIKANNGDYIYLGTRTGQSEFDVYQTNKKMTRRYIKEETHPVFIVINVFAWITLVITIVLSFGTDREHTPSMGKKINQYK